MSRVPNRYLVVAAFLAVPLLWGINWSFMKIGIQYVPPILLLAMRQLLAGLAHGGLALAWRREFPKGRLAVQAILLGVLMAGFSNGLMFWGVQYTSSGMGAILFATMPFFVAFMSVPLLGESLTPAKLAGIAIGFCGVALLIGDDLKTGSDMALAGQAALLLSAVTWALPLVLIRKWLSGVDTIAMTAVQMLSGAAFLLPIGLAAEGLGRVRLLPEAWVSIGYMSVFSGFIAFALYYWLVRHMSATRLALNSFITPAVAVVSGLVLLAEPITPGLLAGLSLVAAGIVVVNFSGERPAVPAKAAASPVGSSGD